MVGLQHILAGNVITCLELTELSINAILSSGLCIVTLGRNLLRLRSNTKKVQKQDLKNIKNVKRCRDGMPKSMQTR